MRRLASLGTWLIVALVLPPLAQAQLASEEDREGAVRHYRIGMELLQAERFDRAEPEFVEAIRLDPLLVVAHYGLGQTYMALQRYASAIQAFTGAKDAFHRIADLVARAQMTLEADRRDEVQALQDSLLMIEGGSFKSVNPVTVNSIQNRVRELSRSSNRGTVPDAIVTPPEISLSLGSAHFRNGDLQQAEQNYFAAVEADENFGEAHNNLAVIYLLTGRAVQALESADRAEAAGFRVNPNLRHDIENALKEPEP